jgi:glycerophosphoryl diester phosphodiesterase
VEIKSEAVARGIVEQVAAAVRQRLMTDRVMVSSFSPAALEQMRSAAPEIRTAVLYEPDLHRGRDPVEIVGGVGASAFNIKRARLTRSILERCHDAGIPVAVYTVNSKRRMRKLVERGVHAVFTDHPDRMLEVVAEDLRSVHAREAPAPRTMRDGHPGTGTEAAAGAGVMRVGTVAGVS